MGTNVRRYLTGLVALAVALAVLMGLSPAAFAASLDNPPPGTNLWYRVDGRNLLIGAIKKQPVPKPVTTIRANVRSTTTGTCVASPGWQIATRTVVMRRSMPL